MFSQYYSNVVSTLFKKFPKIPVDLRIINIKKITNKIVIKIITFRDPPSSTTNSSSMSLNLMTFFCSSSSSQIYSKSLAWSIINLLIKNKLKSSLNILCFVEHFPDQLSKSTKYQNCLDPNSDCPRHWVFFIVVEKRISDRCS